MTFDSLMVSEFVNKQSVFDFWTIEVDVLKQNSGHKMDITKKNPNKSEWIERHKHETIVSQYKTKVQRIISDYDTKIAIQSRKINILMETIRQQNGIIDSFVSHRRSIELTVNENGINFESPADIHRNDTQIAHESQCKHSKQNLEPSSVQCENILEFSNDEAKDAVLLAINIQPNVKRFECNLCDKSFLSKRVLTVRIDKLN